METTEMSINRWMDKEKKNIYDGISPIKRRKTCNSIDEPRGYFAKWNKSEKERQMESKKTKQM